MDMVEPRWILFFRFETFTYIMQLPIIGIPSYYVRECIICYGKKGKQHM